MNPLEQVYGERNLIAQAFAAVMEELGYHVAWGVDPAEPDWPVLYVETEHGQVSWHIPKAERIFERIFERVAPLWAWSDGLGWSHDRRESRPTSRLRERRPSMSSETRFWQPVRDLAETRMRTEMTERRPSMNPDPLRAHEQALLAFARYMLDPERANPATTDMAEVGKLAAFVINGLPAVRAALAQAAVVTPRCEAQVRRHAAINPEEPGYYEMVPCGRAAKYTAPVGTLVVPVCLAHERKFRKLLWLE